MMYRAHAYKLERLEMRPQHAENEMLVFFEAQSDDHARSRLPYLLALAWQCGTDQVEVYGLMNEGEILRQSLCAPEAGDARLIEVGWFHGPLFPQRRRTLAIGSARMMDRIERAWSLAVPLRATQQVSALAQERGFYARRPGRSGADMGLRC